MSEPNYVCCFMLVAAEDAPLARALCVALAGPAGEGMFTFPVSADGTEPASHYLTEGWIEPQFAALMTDPEALFSACQQAGAPVTQAQIEGMLSRATVEESSGNPLPRLAELGLFPAFPPEAEA